MIQYGYLVRKLYPEAIYAVKHLLVAMSERSEFLNSQWLAALRELKGRLRKDSMKPHLQPSFSILTAEHRQGSRVVLFLRAVSDASDSMSNPQVDSG